MAARRRLKDIEGQRARLARKVVASSGAVVVRATAAAAAHDPDSGPECQPNADAPLLRDEGARRKWVDEELFRCCEVGALPWLRSGRRSVSMPCQRQAVISYFILTCTSRTAAFMVSRMPCRPGYLDTATPTAPDDHPLFGKLRAGTRPYICALKVFSIPIHALIMHCRRWSCAACWRGSGHSAARRRASSSSWRSALPQRAAPRCSWRRRCRYRVLSSMPLRTL